MKKSALTAIPGEKIETVEPAKPRLIPIPWADVSSLPRRESIVRGLLDRGAMSVVYGGSNTGKTFFVLDLSLAIARGIEWRERNVRQGSVVYIAAEGGLGIEERLTAYRTHHKVDAAQVPFWLIPEPIDLCKTVADIALLIARLAEIKPALPIELIVVDTLSRAMAGGNENSPDDMGAFVRNLDRLRIETGAHVLVIHHAGKDEGRGARGHSLLKAAADTEIEVTKNGASGVATVAKQRDHAGGDVFGFRLEPVEIGHDIDGHTITSCVVALIDEPQKQEHGPRMNKNQSTFYQILHSAGARGMTLEQWNDKAREAGLGARRRADLHDYREALRSKGLVYEHSNGWSIKQ